ncbi:Putative MFS transporter superfamily [Colletotrichum destructivum]|uniref:MFS transporter superfamily n=1 Tax=Colletotrichum destructivum TaxID=34406 RepID=A0AAX4IL06_9PEZI|nr:Putative MFS transporter superfamily [Colletotrichum destructivum]
MFFLKTASHTAFLRPFFHRGNLLESRAGSDDTAYDPETSTMVGLDAKFQESSAREMDSVVDGRKGYGAASEADSNANKDAESGSPVAGETTATPDGPDDAANPYNWSKAYKLTNVVVVSLSVLYTSPATTMFAPGAPSMQREFGFKSSTVEIMTITMASLGFAVGQLFIPPLSEVFGRMPFYRASSIFYLGFTAGCARSTSIAEFPLLRLLTSLSAASYMLLTLRQGWRCHCRHLSVHARDEIRQHARAKAARLRKETGNQSLRAASDKKTPVTQLVLHAMIRPITILFISPIVALIALYTAFNFGVTMLLFATFPTVYEDTYRCSVSISGLAYFGVGIGCVFDVVTFAKPSDRPLNTQGGAYRAERRLIMMMFVSPLFPIGLFIYGWTTENKVHPPLLNLLVSNLLVS